ncbi:MAG: PD40 domain-containing protein [Deltaproteobacteria bacterium]|nr:PD40 domain-containing protein [Deltaproteobacteria bacterium]
MRSLASRKALARPASLLLSSLVALAAPVAHAQTHGIVFTSALKLDGDANENGGIYLMRPDGSAPRKLTNFQTLNFAFRLHGLDLPDDHASCSPDGKKIAFSSSRTATPGVISPNDFQIFVTNPNGSELRAITDTFGRNIVPVFSPDGSKIAFASDRVGATLHIFVMNADGSNPTQLTSGPDPDSEPAWSPDGTKIAFTRIPFSPLGLGFTQKDVWIVDTNGANLRRLTDTLGEDHDPVFSPDGTKIAYSSERTVVPSPPFGDTFIIDVARGVNDPGLNITSDLSFGAGDPSWHPDGSSIVFFKAVLPVLTSPMQIWTMRPDGSNKVHVTHLFEDGLLNIHPSWCRLADSDADGRPDYLENQNVSFHQSSLRLPVLPSGLGSAVAYADLTHDGVLDVAASMARDSVGGVSGAGRVFLLRGTSFGPDRSNPAGLPSSVTTSTFGQAVTADAELGRTLAGCDFDGDGFSDLAIGAPGQDRVFVMLGKTGPYQTLSGTGRFGAALAAGDFNGDGRCDLAVGSPREARPGPTTRPVAAGAVRVFFGTPSGLNVGAPQVIDQASLPLPADIGGNEGGDEFGAALAAGRLSRDNLGTTLVDLVIGAPGETVAGVAGAGVVHAIAGVAGGPLAVSSAKARDARALPSPHGGLQAGARFGEVLAIGAFGGAVSPRDLVVGVPRQDVGGVVDAGLVATFGADAFASLATTAKVMTAADLGGVVEANAQLGQSLAVGDASGDLRADLAIASPGETVTGKAGAGAVYLVLGSAGSNAGCAFCGPGIAQFTGGLAPSTALRLRQSAVGEIDEVGDRFGGSDAPTGGSTLAFGDLDGDGQADLLVGSPRESTNVDSAGLLSIRYGLRVGIPKLTPTRIAAAAGEPVTLTLDWRHPIRWRLLEAVHVRVVNDDGVAMWVRFREAGPDLFLGLLGDDGRFVEGKPGEARTLASTGGSLDLGASAVVGSGPEGADVTLTLSLVPSEATRGHTFRVELLASDDLGHVQGFQSAGELAVGRDLAAGGSGCASVTSKASSWASLGAAVAALLALAARRRSKR